MGRAAYGSEEIQTKLRRARGQLAVSSRHHPDDTPRLNELRAEIVRLRLEDAVLAALASNPPMTVEVAMAIADLLVGRARARNQPSRKTKTKTKTKTRLLSQTGGREVA